MLKSAIYIYLTAFFVFYSVSSSAFSKKIHILIGNVDGAKVAHFDDMELISFAAITFVSCCAKSDVLPFYRNGEDRPEIDVFYFDAPETGGVIYFDMHMRAFFRREGIWSELLSSINDHQPR